MGLKLNTSSGGSVSIEPTNTASNYTLTVPAQTGTVVATDASGNVGIGTSSPTDKLTIAHADEKGITFKATGTDGITAAQILYEDTNGGTGGVFRFDHDVNSFTFATAGTTERMRIDSSGNLLVGTTDSGQASGVGTKINASTTVPQVAVVHNSSSAGSTGFVFFNTNGTNNGYRFYVRTDGGIYNYSANNFNLSDETEKHDITLSGNYLDKLCQIPVKTFLFNDQNDNDLNLGVIAQDVEKVCPEFITQHNIGTEENPIIKLGVYETDLKYAMLKAIQELKAVVDAQAERITALENK